MTLPPHPLWKLLVSALRASKRAGDAILQVYNSPFTVEYKEDNSPLTRADQNAHNAIVSCLATGEGGNSPILSEEGKSIPYEMRKEWTSFWLVDPLDGTKEFVKRNGEFTVNVALIHNRKPVLGVIYIPVRDLCYFALEGLGAYKTEGDILDVELSQEELLQNSQRLPLAHNGRKAPFTIAGSRSHATEELYRLVESLRERYGTVEFIPAGSSIKFCLVAEGKADMYPRFGPTMEWDTAAGQAIVENASGSVTDSERRKPLSYNKESLLNPWFTAARNSTPFEVAQAMREEHDHEFSKPR